MIKVLTIVSCVQATATKTTADTSGKPAVRTQWHLCRDLSDSMSLSTTPLVVAQTLLHVVSAVAIAAPEDAASHHQPTQTTLLSGRVGSKCGHACINDSSQCYNYKAKHNII